MGLYTVLAILFLYLIRHEVARGPAEAGAVEKGVPITVT